MTTKVKLTYFGVEAEGSTVTAAKQAAGAKIEAAMQGSYSPRVLSFEGIIGILIRTPLNGYEYTLVYDEARYPTSPYATTRMKDDFSVNACEISGYATERECEDAMRMHMAQNAFHPADRQSFKKCAALLRSKDAVREFRSLCEWHYRIQTLRDRGMSDQEIQGVLQEMGELERLTPQLIGKGVDYADL